MLAKFKEVVAYFGSQKRLAEQLEVSEQFVSKVCKGKYGLPILQAMKIEKLTGGKFKVIDLMPAKSRDYLINNKEKESENKEC